MSTTEPSEPRIPSALRKVMQRVDAAAARIGLRPTVARWGLTGLAVVAVAAVTLTLVLPGALAHTPTPLAPAPSAPVSVPAAAPPELADELATADPCGSFFDHQALALKLGVSTDVKPEPARLVLATVGGIDCGYMFGERPSWSVQDPQPNDSGYVYVTVAPSAITDPAILTASLAPASCAPAPWGGTLFYEECTTTATFEGWWYTLVAGAFTSEDLLRQSFGSITQQLENQLGSTTAPATAQVLQPYSCSSLDLGDIEVLPAPRPYFLGGQIATAAFLLAAPTTCRVFISEGEFWDLQVYPGGASAYDQCTRNNWGGRSGETIVIAGVKEVFEFDPQPEHYGVQSCATDGTSTIDIWRSFTYLAKNPNYSWDPETQVTLGAVLGAVFALATPSTTPFTPFVDVTAPVVTSSPVTAGGCAGLLNASTVTALTGGDLSYENMQPQSTSLGAVGGISCRYSHMDEGGPQTDGNSYTLLSVAPSAILPANLRNTTLEPAHCASPAEDLADRRQGCRAVAEVNGWWYTITLGYFGSADERQALFASTVASLESVLSASQAPVRVGAPLPFDCSQTSTPGQSFTSWRTADNQPVRRWIQRGLDGDTDVVVLAASLFAGPTTCAYTMSSGEIWWVTVYRGTTAPHALCGQMGMYAPAAVISIPGVLAAFDRDQAENGPAACATDGISAIEVYRPNPYPYAANPYNWPEVDAAAIGELLLPIFAAAK